MATAVYRHRMSANAATGRRPWACSAGLAMFLGSPTNRGSGGCRPGALRPGQLRLGARDQSQVAFWHDEVAGLAATRVMEQPACEAPAVVTRRCDDGFGSRLGSSEPDMELALRSVKAVVAIDEVAGLHPRIGGPQRRLAARFPTGNGFETQPAGLDSSANALGRSLVVRPYRVIVITNNGNSTYMVNSRPGTRRGLRTSTPHGETVRVRDVVTADDGSTHGVVIAGPA